MMDVLRKQTGLEKTGIWPTHRREREAKIHVWIYVKNDDFDKCSSILELLLFDDIQSYLYDIQLAFIYEKNCVVKKVPKYDIVVVDLYT